MKKINISFLKFFLGCFLSITLSSQGYAQITNAIIMTSSNVGSTGNSNFYQDALDNGGITTTAFLDNNSVAFFAAVAGADPTTDMVIIDNWWSNIGLDQGNSLPDFINNGGHAIVSSWLLSAVGSTNTRAALGIQGASDRFDTNFDFYDWGGSNLFNGLPVSISFSAPSIGRTSTQLVMTPGAGATVGGYVAGAGTPNEGGIIIANGGRTIAIGACVNTAVDDAQGLAFATNSVASLLLPPPVPTLSQWGLIILSLLMMSIVMVFSMAPKMAVANGQNTPTKVTLQNFGFDKNTFFKMWAVVAAFTALGFFTAMNVFGYELTSADPIGGLVATGIVAYMMTKMKATRE